MNDLDYVQDCYAYSLKTINWKETSLIIYSFSREYGIVDLVAKGAKKPYSILRPIISLFQPLSLSWKGKNDIKTLIKVDLEGINNINGNSLMNAWYINELIINFLPKCDAHPKLFNIYDETLKNLSLSSNDKKKQYSLLRYFEWILLEEIGYGLGKEMPDFDNPSHKKQLKSILNKHINNHLSGKILNTKRILNDMLNFLPREKHR